MPNGNVYLAWLDHRGKDRSGAGAIFAASRDHGKTLGVNRTIDGMACLCCRPIMALAPDGGLWVAWRKTFEGNVRDVVLARSHDGGSTFSAPHLVHQDGWIFPACPHRGPSLAFDRYNRLYVAWYTEGVDEQPKLLFSTSDDQGQTFSVPLSLHTSTTSLPDHLLMAVHEDGAIVAVWEEVTGVRKRTVMRVSMDRGKTFGPVQTLSDGAKAEAALTKTLALNPNHIPALLMQVDELIERNAFAATRAPFRYNQFGGAIDATDHQAVRDVVQDGHVREQLEMLEHHADFRTQFWKVR